MIPAFVKVDEVPLKVTLDAAVTRPDNRVAPLLVKVAVVPTNFTSLSAVTVPTK